MGLRSYLLDNLPRSMAKRLYLIRNYETVIEAEILEGVHVKLGVPARNQIWIDRLSQKEGHEVAISRWMRDLVIPGEVVYDIGSCYGYFPALLAGVHSGMKIHAFEGDWKQLYFLQRNIPKNIGDSETRIVSQFLGSSSENGMLSVDDHVKTTGEAPTLVKMDTDGAEYDILLGAKELIAARKTEWLIEIHPNILRSRGVDLKMILDRFDSNHVVKGLIDIRDGNVVWDQDLTKLDMDDNPYIYVAPKEIARFK